MKIITDVKEDMRIKKTRKQLTDALIKLLKEKDFSNISVMEICQEAKVHRATFYKHFNDKKDFLDHCIIEVLSRFSGDDEYDGGEEHFKEHYMAIVLNVLNFLLQNQRMIKLLVGETYNADIMNTFYDVMLKIITSRLEQNEENGMIYNIPISVIASYYMGAFVSLATWWITNDAPYSTEEMMEYVEKLIDDSLYSTTKGIQYKKSMDWFTQGGMGMASSTGEFKK